MNLTRGLNQKEICNKLFAFNVKSLESFIENIKKNRFSLFFCFAFFIVVVAYSFPVLILLRKLSPVTTYSSKLVHYIVSKEAKRKKKIERKCDETNFSFSPSFCASLYVPYLFSLRNHQFYTIFLRQFTFILY